MASGCLDPQASRQWRPHLGQVGTAAAQSTGSSQPRPSLARPPWAEPLAVSTLVTPRTEGVRVVFPCHVVAL